MSPPSEADRAFALAKLTTGPVRAVRTQSLLDWARLISRFVSLQIVIQALGFAIGIMVIRRFSKDEYASYTLAFAMQGMMISLSDLGLGNALLALGGKDWKDPRKMGLLVSTALSVRRYFFCASAVIAGGVWYYFLIRSKLSPWNSASILAITIASVYLQLDIALYSAVLRLNSHVERVQRIDLGSSAIRLALIGLALLVTQSTVAVISAAAASYLVSRHYLKHFGAPFIASEANPQKVYRGELLRLIKAQAPNTIFYCFYGQATILVIGWFGAASKIAEVGALSRLSAALLIVSTVMANIVFPAFARCQDARILSRRYHQVLAAYLTGGGLVIAAAWLYPGEILAILGHSYANLEKETVWMVLSAVLNGLSAVMFGLCAAKGWTRRLWLTIPAIVGAEMLAAWRFDLTTVRGVLLFGSLPILPALVIYYLLARRGLKQLQLHAQGGDFE